VLFKDFHIEPVKSGRKTQTRRLWKRPMVRVGGVYAVKTRMLARPGEPGHHGFMEVMRLRRERLGAIETSKPNWIVWPASNPGARRLVDDVWLEGYDTLDEFKAVWRRVNRRWDPRRLVWVVDFRYIGEAS
jgi:hypothetical protein